MKIVKMARRYVVAIAVLLITFFSSATIKETYAIGFMQIIPDGTCTTDSVSAGEKGYYFETTENGTVRIDVNNDDLELELSKNPYFSSTIDVGTDGYVDLAAGKYYVKVSGTGNYEISANFSSFTDYDKEPNNTKETALSLISGVPVKGNAYRTFGDLDYYKIELKTKSYIDVDVNNGGQMIFIYDSKGEYVSFVYNSTVLILEADTYYIEMLSNNTYGYYDMTVDIVEYPTPNEITSAVYQGSRKVDLTWNKSEYAHGYRLFYKTSENGKWYEITTISSADTISYTHLSGPSTGETYYYGIQAYRKNTVFGEISNQEDSAGYKVTATEEITPITPTTDKTSQAVVEQTILTATNDKDLSDSTFNLLQAKAAKVKKNSIKVTWKKVDGASKYIIYGNQCGKSYKKLKTVTGKSYTQKKLKKGKYYKYLVVAVDKDGNVVAKSKTIHAATKGGKVGNDKKVTLNKKSITLNIGKTFTLKAKAVAQSSKLKVKRHRKMAYESSNKNVATVTKKGKIKAVKAGTCYVYAYTQNGVFAKVKVKVK